MSTHASILLASNAASQSAQAVAYLEGHGLRVRTVYTGADAVNALRENNIDILITDMAMPGGDALWVLDRLPAGYNGHVIILSADDSDPRLAHVGTRASIMSRPFSLSRLHQTIDGLLSRNATLPEDLAGAVTGETALPRNLDFGGFIGTSPVMQALYEQIQNGARSTATVFITGESGTGKEVCAQAVHKHSTRADKPFVPLNCAAIPRDLLESEIFGHVRGAFTGAVSDRPGAAAMADGGTLFLDEIGDMDPNMQTKLLRFLQDGTFQRVGGNRLEHVDVRIICATNRDPVADVKSGRFREDLFYRLHVLPISMPPLRARGGDIIDIAQTLLLRYAAEENKRFKGFAVDAETILAQHNWPGNIRELQNVIRHAVVMHDAIAMTAAMLPEDLLRNRESMSSSTAPQGRSLGDLDGSARRQPGLHDDDPLHAGLILPLHVLERRAIESAIRACHGNIPRAAALLQVSPSTLYRKKAQWDENAGIPAENHPIQDQAGHF